MPKQTQRSEKLILEGFDPMMVECLNSEECYKRGDLLPNGGLAIGDSSRGKTAYIKPNKCYVINGCAVCKPEAVQEAGFCVINIPCPCPGLYLSTGELLITSTGFAISTV